MAVCGRAGGIRRAAVGSRRDVGLAVDAVVAAIRHWLLAAVAAGLVCFGVFQLLHARYAKSTSPECGAGLTHALSGARTPRETPR